MDEQTNPVQQTPVEPSAPAPKKGINKGLALILFILILGAAATGAYWLKDRTNSPTTVNPTPPPFIQNPEPAPSPTPVSYSVLPEVPGKAPALEKNTDGTITWHYPTKNFLDIVEEKDKLYTEFLEVGQYKSGKYANQYLFLGFLPCYCMGGGGPSLFVVDSNVPGKQNKIVLLAQYSDPIDNYDPAVVDKSKLTIDSTTKISDLEFPETIYGPKPNQTLVLTEKTIFQGYSLFDSTNLKLVFNEPKIGSVYTTPDNDAMYPYSNNGFYVKSPDWAVVTYKVVPNFIDDKQIPDVTWSNGAKNTKQYAYTDVSGCGGSNHASVMTSIKAQNDLVLAGMTGKGEIIYELKDKNHSILKDIYNNQYNPYNYEAQKPGTKIPYEQFVANHPAFFWVDPFDRIIKFANIEFQPQAECAKPAIYLYPTKTTEVAVKVDPKGGFTYTDPDYGTGWNVIAKPDGTIIVNGKTYPYLFWEGRGGLYQTPDKGFVVAQADVHNFLVEKLEKLGLNQKETADFIEYWEPYMQGSPYYFVTFMGNRVMGELAPLSVSPKPDTIIRVLMDFKGLEKPVPVESYEIKTPVRTGFTVVEWGGVKH